MKVKLKKEIPTYFQKEYNDSCWSLDKDKVYTVLGISHNDFRLIAGTGNPVLFLGIFFDIVDNTIENDWTILVFDHTKYDSKDDTLSIYLKPKEFQGYFFEDLFDYKREAIDIFLLYVTKHNIQVVANLAYAPNHRKEYYNNLLDRIEKQEKLS